MKRLVIMAAMAAALVGAAGTGYAQPGPGPGGGRRGMEPPTRPMPPPQRDHQMPQRDFRGDPGHDPRRGQLSPEERRQLRRDIGDHGRDVYRDRRPKR
jgi:hypothetical protein